MIYYYTGVSGRTKFVTFIKNGANEVTNEKMPVIKESISDLESFDKLIGKKVKLNGIVGIIRDCIPQEKTLSGKYIGNNRYLENKNLINLNHLVRVYWINGVLPCWQPFFKLELI